MNPDFLDVDDVLAIHEVQIDRFGGGRGIRDAALLASAVGQAPLMFDEEFVHRDVIEMAAAYLFHLVSNHPFVDGNKRVGLASALVFLELNGTIVDYGTQELYELTMSIAEGALDKDSTTAELRRIIDGSL